MKLYPIQLDPNPTRIDAKSWPRYPGISITVPTNPPASGHKRAVVATVIEALRRAEIPFVEEVELEFVTLVMRGDYEYIEQVAAAFVKVV